jgi:succinate dehydrogenase / fumarate reductase cytochrome b subunit
MTAHPSGQPAGHSRPLSPHLGIYRRQLTSVLSILHRVAGIGLAVGMVYLVYWLAAAARGDDAFAAVQGFNGSFIGRLLLFGWTVAFFYHLLNGMRHLAWDAGLGFDLPATYRSGWAVVIGTAVLTLLAWVIGYYEMGSF